MQIDRFTAKRIAEGINTSWGKDHRKQIITANEVLKLVPISTYEPNGYLVYGFQWGDVTILALVDTVGDVHVKHVSW